jgi:hypothetical protein
MMFASAQVWLRTVRAGATYFALVFVAGLVLGSIRVPYLVPRFGERIAELTEMPFMFVVILFAARFIVRRFALVTTTSVRFSVGIIALCLLVSAELLLAVVLQSRSLGEYIASRDPISGGVYLAMLLFYTIIPLIIARVQLAHDSHADYPTLRDAP